MFMPYYYMIACALHINLFIMNEKRAYVILSKIRTNCCYNIDKKAVGQRDKRSRKYRHRDKEKYKQREKNTDRQRLDKSAT